MDGVANKCGNGSDVGDPRGRLGVELEMQGVIEEGRKAVGVDRGAMDEGHNAIDKACDTVDEGRPTVDERNDAVDEGGDIVEGRNDVDEDHEVEDGDKRFEGWGIVVGNEGKSRTIG